MFLQLTGEDRPAPRGRCRLGDELLPVPPVWLPLVLQREMEPRAAAPLPGCLPPLCRAAGPVFSQPAGSYLQFWLFLLMMEDASAMQSKSEYG